MNPHGQPAAPGLRGRHDLGEIIGLSWRIYLGNFGAMFLIALTTVPLRATITSVAGAFAVPFAVTAMTLLYYDLQARREAATATAMVSEAPELAAVDLPPPADRPDDQ